MNMVPARRTTLSAFLASVLFLIGFASPARAQMGMGMDMGQFAAPINRRSLEDYGRLLSLTGEQKDAIKSLYDAYVSSHAEATKEMSKIFQETQEKAQDTGDFRVYQKEMPKKMQAVTARMEGLEKGFYDDAKALLSADQQASWPKVERHRRREKGLRFGFLSGQAVDMVRVVTRSRSTRRPCRDWPISSTATRPTWTGRSPRSISSARSRRSARRSSPIST